MASASTYGAISRYRQVGAQGAVEDATPHHLVTMLFEGALSRIALASACMQRGEVAEKGAAISRVIEIVGALRGSLDMNVQGGLSQRLDALYDYVTRRLFRANIENEPRILDEVAGLLRGVADAWAMIGPRRMAGAA